MIIEKYHLNQYEGFLKKFCNFIFKLQIKFLMCDLCQCVILAAIQEVLRESLFMWLWCESSSASLARNILLDGITRLEMDHKGRWLIVATFWCTFVQPQFLCIFFKLCLTCTFWGVKAQIHFSNDALTSGLPEGHNF